MVRDAGDLYEVGPGAPELDGAVLLHYLDGFIDAGAGGDLRVARPPARASPVAAGPGTVGPRFPCERGWMTAIRWLLPREWLTA